MGSSKSQDFPCINNIWSLVSIDEYPFTNCQNLEAEMMELSQTKLVRAMVQFGRKHSFTHLLKVTVVRLGRPFTETFSYILHSLLAVRSLFIMDATYSAALVSIKENACTK